MLNDARLKEQQRGSTFLAQTHNDVGPSLANSMYPSLSWEAKWWEEWRKRQRDNLVRGLREANANLRKESGR
jgi:hypothetical protein